jgi:hypothetical protein
MTKNKKLPERVKHSESEKVATTGYCHVVGSVKTSKQTITTSRQ